MKERIGGIVATGLGIVLALTPVALWIAWTAALVVWILLVAVACAVLLDLLESSLSRTRNQGDVASEGSRVILPEEFIEEVHRLFPLTYHHSMHPATRFQETMKKLSRLIEGSRPGDSPH